MHFRLQPLNAITLKPICKYIEFNYIKVSVALCVSLCGSLCKFF
jgi:hypothetical protein